MKTGKDKHFAMRTMPVGPVLTGPTIFEKVVAMNELDRRISVAPMMDWTDSEEILSGFASLQALQNACRLYAASARS